jgi:predicted DNA-binding transcriptional regulator AlpA
VRMLGVSRTTLWRMVQSGLFPRPVQITERNRGYVLEDVEAWMQARIDDDKPDRSLAFVAVRRAEPVPVEAVATYPTETRRRHG